MKIASKARLLGCAAAMLLQSCGGGGSPTPTATPTPTPAVTISSGNTATVAENTSGTFYTVAAAGGTGSFTYSLGGADAAFFTVSGSGGVSFTAAPNFDLEADADADNVYHVTVTAASGGRQASVDLQVTVTNLREGIAVTRIATGFTDPVGIARTNVAGQLILGEQAGNIFFVDGTSGSRTPIPGLAPAAGVDLLDVAFGPDNSNFKGPVVMLRSAMDIILYRPNKSSLYDALVASGDTANVDGTVYFDAEGTLLAAIGDPDGTRAQLDDGSSPNRFGKLFHAIYNPFSGASLRSFSLGRSALGVRDPGAIAEVGEFLLLLDRGGSAEHEITRLLRDQYDYNFGWPFFEGTERLMDGAPGGLTDPTLVYPFGNGAREGAGPVGGVAYDGDIAGIEGHFVFADSDGTIWSIPAERLLDGALLTVDELERRTADFLPDQGSIDMIVDLAQDANGTLYILDADGELFRVDPA